MKYIQSKNKLMIIGCSGHGRAVADVAVKMNKWKEIVFLDDDENIKYSMGIEVVGRSSEAIKYINYYDIFVAIGNNIIRKKIQNWLESENAHVPTLIHPNACIGSNVEVGDGTVIMAGTVINCCSKIGKGCIVNTGSTIDHDNVLGNYVHVSPGAHTAGMVSIGDSSWLSTGSIVGNNITIVDNCIIGAGSVVIKDIYEAGTYIGIPARRL